MISAMSCDGQPHKVSGNHSFYKQCYFNIYMLISERAKCFFFIKIDVVLALIFGSRGDLPLTAAYENAF